MTDVIDRTELLQRPASETLPAMRALGMLPERTTDRVWVPDPADIQPSIGLLCQIDPLHPFTAGKASQSAYNPQWFSTSGLPEVSIRSKSGGPNGAIYFNLSGLGAGRKCVAWVDLLVYSSPAGCSITMGATGNPSQVVVTAASTGGKRVSVPLSMTASADGTAFAYFVPSLTGHGGAWYGTTVYGL